MFVKIIFFRQTTRPDRKQMFQLGRTAVKDCVFGDGKAG